MTPPVGLGRPEALLLLVPALALALAALWVERRRRRALAAFAGSAAQVASVSERRRALKLWLTPAALALIAVAASAPYLDVVRRTVVQSGVDLVVALDVSQSMAVRDADPDRLRAAKAFAARLGDQLRRSRVALVLFAGEGVVRYPATADPSVLGRTLETVSLAFRPPGGSSLRAALDAALGSFPAEALASGRRKAVVLLTDGEDTSAQQADVAALRARNVEVIAIGVGTASGGPIPTYDRAGRFSGYLEHADGTRIVSRLDEAPLRALAEGTGGRYLHLGSAAVSDVTTELQRLDASELAPADAGSVPDDRYQPFLLLAVLLLIADGLVSDRRPMPLGQLIRAERALPRRRRRLAWLFVAGAILGSCSGAGPTEGDRLYLDGRNEEALVKYRELIAARPQVAELHVNAGNALYGLARYEDALAQYRTALELGDERAREVAHYQSGDALFRLGRLDEAREAFVNALRLDPGDRDAKINIELIDALRAAARERDQGAQQGRPGASSSPGQGDQGGQGSPGEGQGSGRGSGQGGPAQPGAQGGPQSSGPPTSLEDRSGPSLEEALRAFRSRLSEAEALRLLDALRESQPGIEELLQGSRSAPPGQDPAY